MGSCTNYSRTSQRSNWYHRFYFLHKQGISKLIRSTKKYIWLLSYFGTIPLNSVGAKVPYAYAADCLDDYAVSTAYLIGTDFKFLQSFKDSFAEGYPSFNDGRAEERFIKYFSRPEKLKIWTLSSFLTMIKSSLLPWRAPVAWQPSKMRIVIDIILMACWGRIYYHKRWFL